MKSLRPTNSEIYYALATAHAEGVGVRRNRTKAVHAIKQVEEFGAIPLEQLACSLP